LRRKVNSRKAKKEKSEVYVSKRAPHREEDSKSGRLRRQRGGAGREKGKYVPNTHRRHNQSQKGRKKSTPVEDTWSFTAKGKERGNGEEDYFLGNLELIAIVDLREWGRERIDTRQGGAVFIPNRFFQWTRLKT